MSNDTPTMTPPQSITVDPLSPHMRADELDAEAEKLIQQEAKEKQRTLRSHTMAEMGELDFAVEYIIAGVLAERQPFIFAGKSKTLKSTVMLEMGLSIATGRQFLGTYDVTAPQPVVFLSAESGFATLKDKARAILKQKGLELSDVHNLAISDEIIKINNERDIDAIGRLMEAHKAKILMIDPAYLSMPGDQMSNVFGMGDILSEFTQYCQQNGITWGLCHHSKKTLKHFEPLERDDMAGAGFDEFVRQWFLINHRDPPDMERGDFKLWFNFGGSAGHTGAWGLDINEGIFSTHIRDWRQWEYELKPMKECWDEHHDKEAQKSNGKNDKQREEKIKKMRTAIVKLLERSPETRTQIGERIGRGVAVWAALDELIDEKQVEETTVTKGKNSKEYTAYKLL